LPAGNSRRLCQKQTVLAPNISLCLSLPAYMLDVVVICAETAAVAKALAVGG
jgi:hypothetical protein